jgi:hypothetical protein
MGACPPSPAAATMARFKRPGWSTGATFTQALSCRASAIKNGTAASFEATRSAFETAWRVFLSKRIEADFKAWRDQRDMRYRKAGERLPSQRPNSMMRCACGKAFDSHRLEESLIHVPHLSAAHDVHRAEPLH